MISSLNLLAFTFTPTYLDLRQGQQLTHNLNAISAIPLIKLWYVDRVTFISADVTSMPKNG